MAKILVCDNVALMRMQIKDMLTKAGHQIIGEASNGSEVVEKYKELKPDLITLEVGMPEMDGYQTIQELKALNPNVKVLVCSATRDQDVVIKSFIAGAKDFIVKPLKIDRLTQAIGNTLDKTLA